MEIVHYLNPADQKWNPIPGIPYEDSLGSQVSFFKGHDDWFRNFRADLVIVGVPEDRNGVDNRGCADSPDSIRRLLYGLRKFDTGLLLCDAGNIGGQGLNDRYQALKEVTAWFLAKGTVVVVIGGTHELSFPLYTALQSLVGSVNLVVGDAMVDLDPANKDFSSRSWINRITANQEGLTDLSLMGVQNYLMSPQQEDYIKERHFEILRLADLRGSNIARAEVSLRDAHFVSLDLRVVKNHRQFSDQVLSPHGLESYEACQISRYAGLSDQLKLFGLFEVPAQKEDTDTSHVLAAEIIWHFIDGFLNRYEDYPVRTLEEYKYHVVQLEELGEGLSFYQNPVNGRWWMEVPSDNGKRVVACAYDDYRKTLRKELPEKWWRYFLKSKGASFENEY